MIKTRFLAAFMVVLIGLSGCSGVDSTEFQVSHETAKPLFVHGEMALRKHDYQLAIQYFEALDDRYPFSDYMDQAQANLIYSYYSLQQYDNALAVADSYVNAFSDGQRIDYVYYMRGLIYFERDQTWMKKRFNREPALHDLANFRQSYDNFIKVVKQFPSSSYADDARRRMVYIRNQLAESELLAAKYYYQKRAYMAVIKRLNYLLVNYSEAPQQQQAMKLRRQSYVQLGLKEGSISSDGAR